MSKTINLNYLNGDWAVNNSSGTARVWTRGNYEIVYSSDIFNTGNAGWMVKQSEGVEIFALKTTGDPWASDAQVVWNPNATGYTSSSTANLSVSTVADKYLVSGAGVNSYNGIYSLNNSPSAANGQNVYTNGSCYLFYDSSKWVLNTQLNSQYAYSGELDGAWYSNNDTVAPTVVKYLPYMNLTSGNVKQGVYIDNIQGTFTNDADAVASDMLLGKTAYVNGIKITGNIQSSEPTVEGNVVNVPAGVITSAKNITVGQTLGSNEYTPSNVNQTIITSGKYITGNQVILGDANLDSSNIKAGVTVFGVTGAFTNDANAVSSDIASGKTAYVNGQKLIGSYEPVEIILGEIDENGDFQPVSFDGTTASASGSAVVVSSYYTWNNIVESSSSAE